MAGRRTLYLVQDFHVGENSRSLRAQILGADLVARKLRPVEQQDIRAFAGQRVGGRRAGRSSTNYYDISIEGWSHRYPIARATR